MGRLRISGGAVILATLLTSCASAPPSRQRPQVGCWFDTLHRFVHALIVERDQSLTTWVPRQLMSTARQTLDTEERIAPTRSVRPGYCPDETASTIGQRRNVWAQPDAENEKDQP